ncbi:MAG TPA: hypothetical protein PKE64_03785, partial [Anaerolineae bacterium]|nr:hypothetical protein [Anaerolineae bacterium]
MPGLEQIRWSAWLLVALFIIGCNSTPAVIQAPTQQLAVSNEQLAISNEQLVTSTLHPPTLQPSNPPTLQPSSLPTFQPSTAPPVQPSTPPAAQYSTQPISLTGSLCYPSTETPPLTLFFQNLATQATTELDIPRGLSSYAVELPPGEYIAYAQTVGTRLQGAYTCGADEPCPFTVEPDQSAAIDLCTWYQPPGLQPSLGEQPNDEVWIRLEQAMLARTGPGLETPELSLIESGSLSQATARSADGLWLEVKPAGDDQTGWLHAPLVRIYGNPESLPVKGDNSPVSKPASFTPAVWRSEANPNMVLFRGEIRDEQDRPVNGYSILLDNGTWSVLSH